MDLATVAQLLAAAGLGGVFANLITNASDRRQQRANLLESLRKYELSGSDEDRERYVTCALLAGLPRRLVREYLAAERRALYARGNLRDATGTSPEGIAQRKEASKKADRVIKSQLAVRNLQIKVIWHPWTTLPTLRFRLWRASRGLNPTTGVQVE